MILKHFPKHFRVVSAVSVHMSQFYFISADGFTSNMRKVLYCPCDDAFSTM